jgi:hypothetical protein
VERVENWFEAIAAPMVLAGLTVLLIIIFQQQLAIPEGWLWWIFVGTVGFGMMSYFLLHAHFAYADNSLIGLVLALFYSLPIFAYLFSSTWTPLAEADENVRLIAMFIATLFAYLSVYSILFLGIEKFFDSFGVDINGLGYIFPGFGVDIDDGSKARSWLIVPATLSLPFALALSYYLIDWIYPYSLFDYRISGTNQPSDVLTFVFDEVFRAFPIADIWEIWDIDWSVVAPQPENYLFRVVRTLTNVTFGIAITLLILQLQASRAKGRS